MGARYRLSQHVIRPKGCEITVITINPVSHQFDPTIGTSRLIFHRRRQVTHVVQFLRVIADIALRACQMLTGTNDARQVAALIHPRGIGWNTRIAHEENTAVPVGYRLLPGHIGGDRAVGIESNMAVHIHYTRHDPTRDLLRVPTWIPIRDATVNHPGLFVALTGSAVDGACQVQDHLREELTETGRQLHLLFGGFFVADSESRARGRATLLFAQRCFPFLWGALSRITGAALLFLTFRCGTAPRFLAKAHTWCSWHTRHSGRTAALVHLLHHCLRRFKALNELIYLGHGGTGAARNSRPT